MISYYFSAFQFCCRVRGVRGIQWVIVSFHCVILKYYLETFLDFLKSEVLLRFLVKLFVLKYLLLRSLWKRCLNLFPMHPFSTPWKLQGIEKGCIGNKWVKMGWVSITFFREYSCLRKIRFDLIFLFKFLNSCQQLFCFCICLCLSLRLL